MVKMPSFDELKKAGAGFVDQVKSGIDSVTKKDGSTTVPAMGDDVVKIQFQSLYVSIAELSQLQASQAAQVKKLEAQLSALSKTIASQTPGVIVDTTTVSSAPVTPTNQESDKL
jgi:hypothetical protein